MSDTLLQPRYAESFQCLGTACEETCCRGWDVFVDKATYKKYRSTPALRRLTKPHIELCPEHHGDFAHARIKLTDDRRCPFLTAEELCGIQARYGHAFLSKTCARFPRAITSFDGRMEKALYLSCPEAARQVLLSSQLLPADDGSQAMVSAANSPVPSDRTQPLERRLRQFAVQLVRNASYPLWQRLFVLGIVCRRTQELVAAQQSHGVGQLLAQYGEILAQGSLRGTMDAIPARPGLQLDLVLQLIRLRFQVEQPDDGFATWVAGFLQGLGQSAEKPAADRVERYHAAARDAHPVFANQHPHFLENYVINYIFRTRFPFADTADRVQTAVDPLTSCLLLLFHYRLLHSLLIGNAAHLGDQFSASHAVRLASSFSRAVEHNVHFLDELKKFVSAQEFSQTDGLAVVLCN